MSKLRTLRRHLQPKRLKIALLLQRLQQAEPDPHKLRENFAQIFNQVFGAPTEKEVFAPLHSGEASAKVAETPAPA